MLIAGGKKTAARSAISSRDIVVLVLILLLAFLLRIEGFRQPLVDHFSWREASTAMMADNLPANGWNPLWPEVSWTGNQPGYQGREFQTLTILAAVVDRLFGWSDWHGRAVAILFGLVSTISVFGFVRALSDVRLGFSSSAVYAVMPGAVLIDRSYLPDPAMLAFVLVSLWCLAEGLKAGSRRLLVLAWLTGTLALLAKLPSLAVLPAAIYLVIWHGRRSNWRHWRIWLALALVATSVVTVAYYAWAIHLGKTYPPFHIAGHGFIWQSGFAGFLQEGFYLRTFVFHAVAWLWTPAILVLAAAGLAMAPTGHDLLRRFSLVYLAGCIVFYFSSALELRNNSWNLHVFAPVVAIFAGQGLAAVCAVSGSSTPRRALAVLLLVSVIIGTGRPALTMMKGGQQGEADRRLGIAMSDLSCAGDLVVVSGTQAGSPTGIYYSRRKGWIFPTPEDSPDRDYGLYSADGPPAIAQMERLVGDGADLFGFVRQGRDKASTSLPFEKHYAELVAYLRETSPVLVETDHILIFDVSREGSARMESCRRT